MNDPRHPSYDGPLAGYRVLELGSTVAGPFCGRLMADFGAEVIKVEPIDGDAVRTMGKRSKGESLYAASILRNKSLIALDLRSEEGRDIILRLIKRCDVLVENFRPGQMEKWGLGYDVLSAINSGLVMVRISGFGQSGPYRERPGYGVIGEAVSGLRHITGDPDRPPTRAAVSLTDKFTGLYAAFGAVMALLERKRSGKGQVIDAALYECAFSFMEPHIPAYEKLGHIANRAGSRLPDSTPNNLYATRDGTHIHITAMGEAVFKRLAAAMGSPELSEDPKYATARARSEHHTALDALISDWTANHDLIELENLLQEAAVPATRIYTMADIFADPHFHARQMLVQAPHETLGQVTVAGVVPKLSRTPGQVNQAGGAVGRDTQRVLEDIAGLPAATIERLRARGLIHCLETQAA
ncbi:CaiB/BaiF CoA transferase family protein [Parapusillimonas granuli]|uniref:CoA transferase n=1 Tax=Parapusillimonas granuli TaxID=380911 RepID=A0A853FWI1_9BURK|nr:CoA transferase [Parapusillimonas granuli]MBB5214422.1 crotonobetainyl-CoA:carnitine CoA-transferase CaiB-like acyl-CoA transferase [Parapusillimonas granuli]NYT49168.1 CoA transferase [Parapusillimonas granuli]